MSPMAAPLSDDDMADLAAYLLDADSHGAGSRSVEGLEGQRLYRGGDPNKGIAACTRATARRASAIPLPAIRRSAASTPPTWRAQLRAYRAGTRQTDPEPDDAQRRALVSDAQIDAVAAYVQGLR